MTMHKITSPYGFVPLSEKVVFPEWGPLASQDWPFEDGLSGVLDIEIEAHSPIFVRGSERTNEFFTAPDGTFGIPGSTLRGLFRNTLEIATFGEFDRVDDRRYGVRDLQNRHVYGDHMAAVNAGWLTRTKEDKIVIEVCDFAKIEYAFLQDLAKARGIERFNPGRKQSSPDKYRAWQNKGQPVGLNVDIKVKSLRHAPQDRRLVSQYGQVEGVAGNTNGTLVFTGQPSKYDPRNSNKGRGSGNPKHHDFVFYGDTKMVVEVSPSQFEDFEFIHSDGGEQHRLTGRIRPNPEWRYWQEQSGWDTDAPGRVPVFFLLNEQGDLRAFGLAMMFRLAYKFSVRDAASQNLSGKRELDFVQTLFGNVHDDDKRKRQRHKEVDALKGRVSFGFARALEEPQPMREVEVVLGSPKASYYPNYIEQNIEEGPGKAPPMVKDKDKRVPRYTTYMDKNARVRGWKRYRPIQNHQTITPPRPQADISRVATRFRPLPAGTKFKASLRVHNVKPEELGALLWALDYGGDSVAFHKIGMARPLGYGTIRMRVVNSQIWNMAATLVDPKSYIPRFIAWMDSQVPGWKDTDQIKELVALAACMPAADAEHMTISPNQFTEAKKKGLALENAKDSDEYQEARRTAAREAKESVSSPLLDEFEAWKSSVAGDSNSAFMKKFDEHWMVRAKEADQEVRTRIRQIVFDRVKENRRTKDWRQALWRELEP